MRNLLLLLLLLVSSCIVPTKGHKKPHSKPRPRPVKSIRAESVNYIDKEFAALATADDAVNMAFKIGGQIEQLPVSKGNFVAQGALLAGVDPREVELQLKADISAYQQAQSKYERMQRLYARNAVSKQEMEAAQTEFIRAETTYENSYELLSQTRLFAPFNGVVERVYVDTYERVTAGESIVRVVSSNTSNVEFTIAQHLLSTLTAPSTKFHVRFLQYPDMLFDASLKDFARSSSDGSGLPVSLTIKRGEDNQPLISPGMPCSVVMSVAQSEESLISIPLSAIYAPAQGGEYVWIIDSANQVELRPVKLDITNGNQDVIISSGVLSGERVVTAGVYQLSEGESVSLLN